MHIKNIKFEFPISKKMTLEDDIPETVKGLLIKNKYIPYSYLYDKNGSDLFTEITKLPNYYLTRKEYEILKINSENIAKKFIKKTHFNLVEFGSGNGEKSRLLLDSFLNNNLDFTFIPIDISETAMEQLKIKCNNTVNIQPIINDYIKGLELFSNKNNKDKNISPNLFTFLGSTIGNIERKEAINFLTKIHGLMKPDDLFLIGMDIKKDIQIINKAYNDSEGLIDEFNYNLLKRMNNDFNANFDVDNFCRYSFFNPSNDAMEHWLMSKIKQSIYFKKLNLTVNFEKFEFIKTIISVKYSNNDIYEIANESGFEIIENYYDNEMYFVDSLWKRK